MPVCTPMYGLPLSLSGLRILSIFQSVCSEEAYGIELKICIPAATKNVRGTFRLMLPGKSSINRGQVPAFLRRLFFFGCKMLFIMRKVVWYIVGSLDAPSKAFLLFSCSLIG